MVILGIETSCDETAASVVEDGTKVLSHVLASSAGMHAKTGGIIPEVAAREQLKSIIPVISESLIKASEVGNWKWESRQRSGKLEKSEISLQNPHSHLSHLASNIDAIAVTYGPGLIGSLLVGVETAKTLAYVWNKPLVPTNHLIGHIYANWLETDAPQFPTLALVVSGGHTDLVLMKDHGKVEWLGGTRDDADGEAFDKTARLLGLPYPGGPAIAAEAAKYQSLITNRQSLSLFPRPMLAEDNFDWSFSGLKTAVSREVSGKDLSKKEKVRFAAEIQEAIVDSIVGKVTKAVRKYKPKSLLVGGGVAANPRLREKLELAIGNLPFSTNLYIAAPEFCTDNGAMIATTAYFNYNPIPWEKVYAVPELTIIGE